MNSDIRNLDLNLLKALDALLDERSVTRAADRLALTQPAVSGMLNRLRESFDDPLFVRAQRGIVPTLRGEQLAGPVKQLLSDIEGMLQPQAFDPASTNVTFRLAATDYALQAVVIPFLSALREQAPNIRVSVQPVETLQLPTQLERGEIDLALITPETTPHGLHSELLFEERYVCVMRANHPDAEAGKISLDRFCTLDHVLVSPSGGSFRGVTDDALERIGRSRRVITSVTSFLVLPELLMVGDLIAVVPCRLVLHDKRLKVFDPPIEIPGFGKSAAWHDRTHREASHRWIRSLMAGMVKSLI
ncbi:TPA: LysR family transcriptional regulator [Pseudomonas aeruginosa]